MKIDSFSAELGPSSTLFDLVSGYDGVPLVLLRLGGVDNGLLRPVVDEAVDQEARRGDRALRARVGVLKSLPLRECLTQAN